MDDSNYASTIDRTTARATMSIKTLTIFTVIALVAVLSLFANPRPAYADDGTFCQQSEPGVEN